jgi:hypothetical protein
MLLDEPGGICTCLNLFSYWLSEKWSCNCSDNFSESNQQYTDEYTGVGPPQKREKTKEVKAWSKCIASLNDVPHSRGAQTKQHTTLMDE